MLAFLRGYNDAVDSERRQDLYCYASEAVGSRGGPDVVDARTDLLEKRTRELREARRRWSLLQRLFGLEIQPSFGSDLAFAVRTLSDRGQHGHAEALALVDELLAIGRRPPALTCIDQPRAQRDTPWRVAMQDASTLM